MQVLHGAIRVLTVDDHPLIREGIAAILAGSPDIELAGEASTGDEAVAQYRMLKPDVTLMDLQMPGMLGIDAMSAIRQEHPEARVVVLTTFAGDVRAERALKAGAQAYLLKCRVRTELAQTIRAVMAGRRYIDTDVAMQLAQHTADDNLSRREIQVLELVAGGKANKQIAHQLSVKSILSKLGASDRTHAVMVGLNRGVLQGF
jgi:DNA-binding NarL/FixJ family response regulator